MARKFKIAKLEDVPEAERPLYVPKNGAYVLDVEGVVEAEELARVEASRGQFGKENAKLTALIKKAEDAGIDLTDDDALTALSQIRQKDLAKQSDLDRAIAEVKALTKRIEKLTAENEHNRAEADRLTVEREAHEALRAHKGNPKVLQPHIDKVARVVYVDGKREIEVVDQYGKPRTGDKGERFTLDMLVQEMQDDDDFSGAFEGTGSTGGGAPPESGQRRGARSTVPDMSKWTPEQKLAWVHANPDTAERLKREGAASAGK